MKDTTYIAQSLEDGSAWFGLGSCDEIVFNEPIKPKHERVNTTTIHRTEPIFRTRRKNVGNPPIFSGVQS